MLLFCRPILGCLYFILLLFYYFSRFNWSSAILKLCSLSSRVSRSRYLSHCFVTSCSFCHQVCPQHFSLSRNVSNACSLITDVATTSFSFVSVWVFSPSACNFLYSLIFSIISSKTSIISSFSGATQLTFSSYRVLTSNCVLKITNLSRTAF